MEFWERRGNFGNRVTATEATCRDFSSKQFLGQIDVVIRGYGKTREQCDEIVTHVTDIVGVIPNVRGVLMVIDATAAKGAESDGATAKNFYAAWAHCAADRHLAVGHLIVEGDPAQREWTRDLNAADVFLAAHSHGDHSLLFISSEASPPHEELEQMSEALRTHTPFVTLRDTPDSLSAPVARLRRRYGGRWADAMQLLAAGYGSRMPDPDALLMLQLCDRNTFCLWRGSELREIGGFDSFCNTIGGMEDVHARRVLAAAGDFTIPPDTVVIRYHDTRMDQMSPELQARKAEQFAREHSAILRICLHDLVPTPPERQDFPEGI